MKNRTFNWAMIYFSFYFTSIFSSFVLIIYIHGIEITSILVSFMIIHINHNYITSNIEGTKIINPIVRGNKYSQHMDIKSLYLYLGYAALIHIK